MNSEFKTPQKHSGESSSPTPDTVKHIKNPSIFANSGSKSNASPISEKRYNQNNSLFEKTFNDSDSDQENVKNEEKYECPKNFMMKNEDQYINKVVKKLEFNQAGNTTRNLMKAISKDLQKRKIGHIRHVSDTDSVVYIGSDDEKNPSELNSYPFILGQNRESLSVFDSTPCMAYCRYCKTDVHTIIDFYHSKVSKKLTQLFSSIFTCCSFPAWLSSLRVHKCPNCSLVIAKCR